MCPTLGRQELSRVALARVLMLRPAVILADEPTSRLDPVSQQDTVALMHDACAETGCTVLLVTHESGACRRGGGPCGRFGRPHAGLAGHGQGGVTRPA